MASYPSSEYTLSDGQKILIRTAAEADAPTVKAMVETYISQNEGQVWEPGEFTPSLEEERAWIAGMLAHPAEILLVAEVRGVLVGNIDFHVGKRLRIAHQGEFGMGVLPAWRSRGVGALLIRRMLEWAAATPQLEKINLRVLANNARAIGLYEKLGFVREGLKRGEFKFADGSYVDEIHMGKWIR